MNEENFEEMLNSYDPSSAETLKRGDRVKARIISITSDTVFVDIGSKMDGAVAKSEFIDKNGELTCKTGDSVDLYVTASGESEIILSKAISSGGSEMIREAYDSRIPVEGKVASECKGGFNIEIMKKRAFCPISQIDIRHVENAAEFIGQTLTFVITKFEEGGRNIVVSRRELLNKELESSRKEFLSNLKPGSVYKGRVQKIIPVGAIVEIFPGLTGMVHISELSWSRTEKPEDVVRVGDNVDVALIKTEKTADNQLRISLSIKKIAEDPMLSAANRFTAGDIVSAKITRLTQFGAFAEIEPGVEGLIHVSEMSYTKRVHKPSDMVSSGDVVQVSIKSVDPETKKISLSMKAAEGDPWALAAENFKPGSAVEGTVEKKEAFGLFIKLAPGVTGLLPKSIINESSDSAKVLGMKPGDKIQVFVGELNIKDRKISLRLTGSEDTKDDWKNHAKSQQNENQSMGSFGEKLAELMKNKK
ncbi:S1 RNA-binding domain-containing protein [Desulforegula conservatrix]|uniref:S1 RNA-binding domain-containing protein n=1 Tax=Desulforegula conservatrix TaxID=153026 RepID=UPI0003F7B4CE|nr:S1 RNA-binding domain-containing protein [Desulforegula conservatrix]